MDFNKILSSDIQKFLINDISKKIWLIEFVIAVEMFRRISFVQLVNKNVLNQKLKKKLLLKT